MVAQAVTLSIIATSYQSTTVAVWDTSVGESTLKLSRWGPCSVAIF